MGAVVEGGGLRPRAGKPGSRRINYTGLFQLFTGLLSPSGLARRGAHSFRSPRLADANVRASLSLPPPRRALASFRSSDTTVYCGCYPDKSSYST